MHSIIAVRGLAMAATVEQTPDRRWLATRGNDQADGDTPEEASDALSERIKAQT